MKTKHILAVAAIVALMTFTTSCSDQDETFDDFVIEIPDNNSSNNNGEDGDDSSGGGHNPPPQ